MPTVAVVTGSSKGIGFAIVRSLCKKLESSDVVYLTSRNEALGVEAVKKLKEEGFSVHYHQLDINDEESIRRLKNWLDKTHDGFDILVNNAAIFLRDENMTFLEKTEGTLKTNYFDTIRACKVLLPSIRPHGRVVFVSSGLAPKAYKKISEELKHSFREVKNEGDVQNLMNKFVCDVKAGNHVEMGWLPGDDGYPPYKVSKLGIIAATKVLAENLAKDQREGILINCCAPGFVATEMNLYAGRRTIDEGAVTSVILALLPRGSSEPQGQYMNHNQQIEDFLKREGDN